MNKRIVIRLVLIAAVAIFAYFKHRGGNDGIDNSVPDGPKRTATLKDNPLEGIDREATGKANERINGYEVLRGARLVDHRNNDGDSFFVEHQGRQFELRLYYVDTPEKYLSDRHEDQRRRVAEQGQELGGLSDQQTIAVGQEAKAFVLNQIGSDSFDVYTRWERVYEGERFYGFVDLVSAERYLSEELIAQGLGRIHTKGPGRDEELPDGRSDRQFYLGLKDLEKQAQRAGRGAWGK
ncbi:MAG: hypothetical protein AAF236_08225 [Verrucomicrobiota bacterium]